MIRKLSLVFLVVIGLFVINQPIFAQIDNTTNAQTNTYSHAFVGKDLVIFQHQGNLINAYFTVQNVQMPHRESIKKISKVDYYKDAGRLEISYNRQSKIFFSTEHMDVSNPQYVSCDGVGQNINDEGYSKDNVLKVVASWQ